MDKDITEAEVRLAIGKLRSSSAPGPDHISNRALRNLDDLPITAITDFLNTCWRTGELPGSWKHAKVILIPKTNKPLAIEHLRPISLTSCLGKLMEHVILARLTTYMNDREQFPHTMIGFRTGLSTQDILLQLSEQIIKQPSGLNTAAILTLDLTKAFDNVAHEAIMSGLGSVNPGEKTYSYIRNFLSNRTAAIHLDNLVSDTFPPGSQGTPQGAVLSPLLFNLAIIDIPKKLAQIPHLHHSLYADDITLWTNQGNDGHIEETVQIGIEVVLGEARRAGLACSPAKSELLVNPPNQKKQLPPNIKLHIDGRKIPEVPALKVLGLQIQFTRLNHNFLQTIERNVNQTIGLLKRVTNKHVGLTEQDRVRLLQAFVVSRIVYSIPYLKLTKAETDKIDILIRRAYKAALRLPPGTTTVKGQGWAFTTRPANSLKPI
ncbi:hypothetical protein ISCGN_020118 [Ixodes scapularis]